MRPQIVTAEIVRGHDRKGNIIELMECYEERKRSHKDSLPP